MKNISAANLEKESLLFIGDNGRCTCWKHSGRTIQASAKHGRITVDLSGEPVAELTFAEASDFGVVCEDCETEQALVANSITAYESGFLTAQGGGNRKSPIDNRPTGSHVSDWLGAHSEWYRGFDAGRQPISCSTSD